MLSETRSKKKRIAIAIPSSFVSDTPHLREKTARIGLLGRAAAIFHVNEILIYPPTSRANPEEARFLRKILSYLETPQYLRKRIFPISPEMKYVGVLPPLRTPHHPMVNDRKDRLVTYREGLVLRWDGNWAMVDIGQDRYIRLKASGLKTETRVTIKIEKGNGKEKYSVISRENVPAYWGYDVTICEKALGEVLKQRRGELIIITSRYGRSIVDEANRLKKRVEEASRILVVFGSPQEGVGEILARERLGPGDLTDIILNTIPDQGTETVRTEEAIYATMAILNLIMAELEEEQGACSQETSLPAR
jgi:predicted SPOUT superfamily RNA methylase MTH1